MAGVDMSVLEQRGSTAHSTFVLENIMLGVIRLIYVIALFEGITKREMSLKDNCWNTKTLRRGYLNL